MAQRNEQIPTSGSSQQGRLMSEVLGPRLFNAIRSRIMRDRMERAAHFNKPEPPMRNFYVPSNTDWLTPIVKKTINHLNYLKKVQRGMLVHLEWMEERLTEEQMDSETPQMQETNEPPKKRRRTRRRIGLPARKRSPRGEPSIKKQPPRACNQKETVKHTCSA